MLSLYTVILSLSLPFAVSAIPFHQLTRSLPHHVTHIAHDETNNLFIAYTRDGDVVGRYPATYPGTKRRTASQCADLSLDELKTLPGWNALEQYRKDNWGNGSHKTVTNPSDYPQSPAEACMTTDTIDVSFSGSPECSTSNVSTSGTLVGTSGSVSITLNTGFQSTGSWTVSTSSTIGVSSTLSAKVGIPGLTDVSESLTLSTDITNSRTSSFSTSYSNSQSVTLSIDAPEGKTCNAVTSLKTCTQQATGKARYLATGWVWYNYDSRTKGHYKWAASIDAVIVNEDDRSSFASFQGSIVSSTTSAYRGTCA